MAREDLFDIRVAFPKSQFKKILENLRSTYAIEGGIQLEVPGVCILDLRVDEEENGKVFLRPKPLTHVRARECIKEGLRLLEGIFSNVKPLSYIHPELYFKEYRGVKPEYRRTSWYIVEGLWEEQ